MWIVWMVAMILTGLTTVAGFAFTFLLLVEGEKVPAIASAAVTAVAVVLYLTTMVLMCKGW